MVNEEAFRTAWKEIDALHCPFAKALLGGHGDCRHAQRHYLAERIGIGCRDAAHQAVCSAFIDGLRRDARFALATTHASGGLPHGLAMKLQVGGLRGLHRLLEREAVEGPVTDVVGLFVGVIERYGSLDGVPMTAIVQEVSHFIPRRPHGDR